MKSPLELIAAERERMRLAGYDAKHDDGHDKGELTGAAACCLTVAGAMIRGSTAEEWPHSMVDGLSDSLIQWPFEEESWKPVNDQVRMLARGVAFALCEMERIQRRFKPNGH